MNETEKNIIEETQSGLPVCEKPFEVIAKKLGISEKKLISTLAEMKEKQLIRRIGAVPNHYAIGYTYNLMTVWDINEHDIEKVGKAIGGLDFVSHCYQRPRHLPDWPYNFFAMVHGRSEREAKDKMNEINDLVGKSCRQFSALKSTKILKKTGLRI